MNAKRGAGLGLALVGVFVAALSLRSPVVAPTPVMREISADLGIDSATAGLLTTAPILMFALMTPIAALVIRRRGPEVALMTTLLGVLVGTFVRGLPGFGWMLAGMIIIGASITIGNVVAPVIIRRDVSPGRVALATAAYAAMLNAGSLITSLATAPLADLIGWEWALLTWSIITVAGVVVWGIHMDKRRKAQPVGGSALERNALPERDEVAAITGPTPVVVASSVGALLRRPLVILLMLGFGFQSSVYYSLTTWLPTIGADELNLSATAAGAMSSVFQGVAIAGAFVVPLLMKWRGPMVTALVVCACYFTVTAGMAIAPSLMMLWMIIGAVAQAGGFVTIFAFMVNASRTDGEAAGMSAIVQGGGYIIASLGAPLTGALHDVSGGWTVPLLTLVAIVGAYTLCMISAATLTRK